MTTVLVHGNPETSVIWRDFVPELEQRGVRDVVLLSPPGFGSPIPDGFGGTMTNYRDWLVGKLQSMRRPDPSRLPVAPRRAGPPDPGAGEDLVAEQPSGLIFDATADAFVDPALSREMAHRLGLPTLTLAGHGHWWMIDQPAKAADGLLSFWG
ncbi:alpha/beta fold hydrolase [Amycolatopsis sp. NPDC051903]|uniref:alpha/beta fold hydrolase n=1 Tax=Amycolatopsis sp. NPDC051903 TaxID=3363936 RepID=UPI003788E29A